jgi:hypothetical protein
MPAFFLGSDFSGPESGVVKRVDIVREHRCRPTLIYRVIAAKVDTSGRAIHQESEKLLSGKPLGLPG